MALEASGEADASKVQAHEAIARIERHLRLNPDDTRALTLGASNLVVVGRNELAFEWLERAMKVDPDDVNMLHNCGCAYAAAGEIDRALEIFERRFALGSAYKEWIDNDPDFDQLRDDPRFQKILRTN